MDLSDFVLYQNIEVDFKPFPGDWVVADIVTFEDSETVRVLKIKPLRQNSTVGKVSSVQHDRGIVDGEIVYFYSACDIKYQPRRGDSVTVVAIESDQGRFQWRALSINPKQMSVPSLRFHTQKSPTQSNFMRELLSDKNSITISSPLDFQNIHLGKKKYITAWIRNEGCSEKVLLLCKLQTSGSSDCQFLLGMPKLYNFPQQDVASLCSVAQKNTSSCVPNNALVLPPRSVAYLNITCDARHLGKTQNLVLFKFQGFEIARYVTVKVEDSRQEQLNPSAPYQPNRRITRNIRNAESVTNGMLVPGEKLRRSRFPLFFPQYPVPNALWEAVLQGQDILSVAQCLIEKLAKENYADKFSTLLHLEEIQMQLDMEEFDIKEAPLRRCKEYLALHVPGLAEGRPSVLLGDKVILSSPVLEEELLYEGFVHEVLKDEVLLKFHSSFHSNYNDEVYNVSFALSRTALRRCHQAVFMISELPANVLFPSVLHLKNPQVQLIEDSSKNSSQEDSPQKLLNKMSKNFNSNSILTADDKNPKISELSALNVIQNTCGPVISHLTPTSAKDYQVRNARKTLLSNNVSGKRLTWVNKTLNERQKAAVKRIVSGQCRPTPYIIFGPPGTGKTVTVVEAILQIYLNVPSSRIIACTPSNSAADLITLRIHESKRVQAVDLARLNAFQRIEENIPEEIRIYCKNSNDLDLLSHHRIVISTCTTAGNFYSLGLTTSHFTHVFVDEAGQATEPECLVPINLAVLGDGQVILAGDPLQLGPVLRSRYAQLYGLQISLLERFMDRPVYSRDEEKFADHGNYDPLIVTKLVNNYRSHSAILSLPSRLFYHNELVCCASKDQRKSLCYWDGLPKTGFPIVFHGVKGSDMREGNSPSWFNPAEVVQVVKYVQSLYRFGLKPDDVGVITPYRKQVEKIKTFFSSLAVEYCKVGSVEEFQGQERLAIIISTVRACEEYVEFDSLHNLGFLSNPKRFNVAVTRAQGLLVVVGDPLLLSKDSNWNELLMHCVKNGAYTGCNLRLEELPEEILN
ncbi:RNA helicase Mov10l1-like isoform X1 [Limulus polyphemus]|uniref:RNA helicase n=2 Tax=Limulus polyphemus TaxID=6850 RepID=A0ABM1S6N7_LIMPO|nr:RNA helicase Mov10l1-like isoform X1 [Limulus polyphemus]XP_022239291.1 RNA helicase Mov10l1-like isoform X1 [Limulus polyphemus]XP_022239292.1 RNA helicase Mov10l1-like isoform X1 [Limulus polyphemus]